MESILYPFGYYVLASTAMYASRMSFQMVWVGTWHLLSTAKEPEPKFKTIGKLTFDILSYIFYSDRAEKGRGQYHAFQTEALLLADPQGTSTQF